MYELWDLVSGNLLGSYSSESEALAWVGRYLEDEGPAYVHDLALDGPDATGQRRQIAEGVALVELARSVSPSSIG